MAPHSKNANRIAVLDTEGGDHYIIRSNPSVKEVLGFVKEHNRRAAKNIPGGPSGIIAQHITSAYYYPNEVNFDNGVKTGRSKIDLDT